MFEFLAISKALGRQADDPEPHRSTYCCLYLMMKTKLSLHDDTDSIMKAIANMNIIFTAEYQVWGREIVKAAWRQILGRIQQEVQQHHVRNIVAAVKVVINIFISIAFWIQIQIKKSKVSISKILICPIFHTRKISFIKEIKVPCIHVKLWRRPRAQSGKVEVMW